MCVIEKDVYQEWGHHRRGEPSMKAPLILEGAGQCGGEVASGGRNLEQVGDMGR